MYGTKKTIDCTDSKFFTPASKGQYERYQKTFTRNPIFRDEMSDECGLKLFGSKSFVAKSMEVSLRRNDKCVSVWYMSTDLGFKLSAQKHMRKLDGHSNALLFQWPFFSYLTLRNTNITICYSPLTLRAPLNP